MIHLPFAREPVRGRVLRGDVRIPEGPPPRSAIVVVHGFKGFKDWGFFPFVSAALAGAGHAVVSFNFSGSGIGSDPERFTELDAFAANTFSRELEELAWVMEWVTGGDLLPRRPRVVGLLGHSRGGGDAILYAARDEHVAALATWAAVSTFERWSEDTRAEWKQSGRIYVMNARTGQQMPLDAGLLRDLEANPTELDVLGAAGRVTQPWLIVHGENDATVDLDEGRALVRAAPRGRLAVIQDAGHTFEVGHPFLRSSPQLDQALAMTRAHFALHLAGE